MSKKVEKKDDQAISRRSFLKGTAVTAGGLAAGGAILAGGAVALSGDKNLERPYPEVEGNMVNLPDNGKEVVIVDVRLSTRAFSTRGNAKA